MLFSVKETEWLVATYPSSESTILVHRFQTTLFEKLQIQTWPFLNAIFALSNLSSVFCFKKVRQKNSRSHVDWKRGLGLNARFANDHRKCKARYHTWRTLPIRQSIIQHQLWHARMLSRIRLLHQLKRVTKVASRSQVVLSAPFRILSSFYGHEDQTSNMADDSSAGTGEEKLSKKWVCKNRLASFQNLSKRIYLRYIVLSHTHSNAFSLR